MPIFAASQVVYEVDPTMGVPERGTDTREVWDVPPEADFVAEATWRLARANAVDARDITNPKWAPRAMALAAGATLGQRARSCSVVLPDGRLAWCDGGPLLLWRKGDERLEGAVVVPRIALAKGRLTPVEANHRRRRSLLTNSRPSRTRRPGRASSLPRDPARRGC